MYSAARTVCGRSARLTPVAPPYQDSNHYKEQSVAIDASGNTVAVGLGVFAHIQSNGQVAAKWKSSIGTATWTRARPASAVFGVRRLGGARGLRSHTRRGLL